MRWLVFAISIAFAGCVPDDGGSLAPCSDQNTCLPGFRCLDKVCFACETGQCPGDQGSGVGPRGGVVCGADNVCLHIPVDALLTPITVAITRGSQTILIPGVTRLSNAYELLPTATPLQTPALVEIPVSTTIAIDRIAVYGAEKSEGPWWKLTGTSTSVTARGELSKLSVVAAGFE